MTGEMSRADLKDYPLHQAIAKAIGGELHPFDVYQGPYIRAVTPKGLQVKLWISDEGLWEEYSRTKQPCPWDEEGAVDAAQRLLARIDRPDMEIVVKGCEGAARVEVLEAVFKRFFTDSEQWALTEAVSLLMKQKQEALQVVTKELPKSRFTEYDFNIPFLRLVHEALIGEDE